MKVLLRPLGRNAWSGTGRFKNCAEYLGTYLTRSGRCYTGLSEEDTIRLESELKGIDLSPTSNFWNTFFIRVGTEDVILNTDDPLDELKYIFLKNHRRVADSLLALNASADYVLINQDEEAKEVNKAHQIKRKALKELDKMSKEDMRKALRVLGNNPSSDTFEVIENKLIDLVESNPESFIKKWVDNQHRETEFLIKAAVNKNVIRKNKTTYNYGTDVIGRTLEDAVEYLDSPSNQDIKLAILNETEVK